MATLIQYSKHLVWGLCFLNVCLFAQSSAGLQQRVDDIVSNYIPQLPYALTISIIDEGNFYQYGYGSLLPKQYQKPDTNTMFRIGAVSKTFAATLLQALVKEKKVSINDPIAQFLPDSIHAQNPFWQSITLYQLATHTAGLPKDPPNLSETYTDNNNLYGNYTIADMYHALLLFAPDVNATKPKIKNKTTKQTSKQYHFNYSHFGIILLAHCLEKAAGKNYDALLQQYITQPLQMSNTTLLPNKKQIETQVAQGHAFNGQPKMPITWGDTPQAEGLYSNSSDMLKYINAYLVADTQSVFSMINRPVAYTDVKNVSIVGGWFMFQRNKKSPTVLTHSGRVGGYACYVAFEPRQKVAVVIMANAEQHIDEVGIAILELLLR